MKPLNHINKLSLIIISLPILITLLAACGQPTNIVVPDPTTSQTAIYSTQIEAKSTPSTPLLTATTTEMLRTQTLSFTPTPANTPTITKSPMVFSTPISIKDIPVPSQATRIKMNGNNEVVFFIPLDAFKTFSEIQIYYDRELQLLGWKGCHDTGCFSNFVTMTDAAYSFYEFISLRHNGPFLQILGCPDEIIYCKESAIKIGGFNISMLYKKKFLNNS